MPSEEIKASLALLEFDGKFGSPDPFSPVTAIWFGAMACALAKAGYIISHQNRG